jgi:hypothetical protein
MIIMLFFIDMLIKNEKNHVLILKIHYKKMTKDIIIMISIIYS